MGAPGSSYWTGSVLVYNVTSKVFAAYVDDDNTVLYGSYLGKLIRMTHNISRDDPFNKYNTIHSIILYHNTQHVHTFQEYNILISIFTYLKVLAENMVVEKQMLQVVNEQETMTIYGNWPTKQDPITQNYTA